MSTDDAERYVSGVKTEVAIARVRARVASSHVDLVRHGLLIVTVSERVPGAELFVIRPAGAAEDELAPENMILCDLDGAVVPETPGSEGFLPADASIHAHLYRRGSRMAAIVHAESGHAAAWATRGEPIPCVTTAMADEFGGVIPVVGAAGADPVAIADAIAESLLAQRSRAVLVPQHGAFAVGPSAKDAVRSALLLEDSARTVQLARAGGAAVAPLAEDLVTRRYERSRAPLAPTTADRR